MAKKLSEMTLEELWRLFPIRLEPHSDAWADYYAEMADVLTSRLKHKVMRISHIGSTSIKNIFAKPIVDILLEIASDCDMSDVAREIEKIGFTKMSESSERMSFNYGYTENGFAEKVYHLHLRHAGDNDELYFRDYLNEFPNTAKEYESLKLHLSKLYRYDRDAYTNAKTDFIQSHTARAKQLYPDRYV